MQNVLGLVLLAIVLLVVVATLVRVVRRDQGGVDAHQTSDEDGRTESVRPVLEDDPPPWPAKVLGRPEMAPPAVPGTTILIGDEELKRGYEILRSREDLHKIKAVWSAGYQAEAEYFEQERRHLERYPNVQVERVVSRDSPNVRYLHRLATEHPGRYSLFASASSENSFEVFVCEYRAAGRPTTTSGILTVVHPEGREPECGFLVDGYENGDLTAFARALEAWFESIKGPPLIDAELDQDVWDASADVYDSYVSRESTVPFLRDFIRAEDACLARIVERSEEDPLVYLEFGSGTGRTIDYLRALSPVAARVRYFIGIDNSQRMVKRAMAKRDREREPGFDKTFYFQLDGRRASQNFGNGRLYITDDLNDAEQLRRSGVDAREYEAVHRILICLLNTIGVVRGDARRELIENMFACATETDTVVLSVFAADAFGTHALDLYRAIQPVVGTDVVPGEFSNETRTFMAGNYFSEWFTNEQIYALVETAGGHIRDVEDIRAASGAVLGRVYVCSRAAGRRRSMLGRTP